MRKGIFMELQTVSSKINQYICITPDNSHNILLYFTMNTYVMGSLALVLLMSTTTYVFMET